MAKKRSQENHRKPLSSYNSLLFPCIHSPLNTSLGVLILPFIAISIVTPEQTVEHFGQFTQLFFVSDVISGIGSVVSSILSGLWSIMSFILGEIFDLFAPIIQAFLNIINSIILAFVHVIFDLFLLSMLAFLTVPNPANNPDVQNIFWASVVIVNVFYFAMLAYQLTVVSFINTEAEVDLQTLIEPFFKIWIIILVGQPIIELIILLSNLGTVAFFPIEYNISELGGVLSEMAVSFGLFVAIGMVILFSTTIAITGVILYIVLAVRLVFINIFYSLFPILVFGQQFPYGPAKYIRVFSNAIFSMTVIFLFLGVLIGAFLQVGLATSAWYLGDTVGGQHPNLGIEFNKDITLDSREPGNIQTEIDTQDVDTPDYDDVSDPDVDGQAATSQHDFFDNVIGILLFLAPLWVIITLTTAIIFMQLIRVVGGAQAGTLRQLLGGGALAMTSFGAASAATLSSGGGGAARRTQNISELRPDEDTESDSGHQTDSTPLTQKGINAGETLKSGLSEVQNTTGRTIQSTGKKIKNPTIQSIGESLQSESITNTAKTTQSKLRGEHNTNRLTYSTTKTTGQKAYTTLSDYTSSAARIAGRSANVLGTALLAPDGKPTVDYLKNEIAQSEAFQSEDIPDADGPPHLGFGNDPKGKADPYGHDAQTRYGVFKGSHSVADRHNQLATLPNFGDPNNTPSPAEVERGLHTHNTAPRNSIQTGWKTTDSTAQSEAFYDHPTPENAHANLDTVYSESLSETIADDSNQTGNANTTDQSTKSTPTTLSNQLTQYPEFDVQIAKSSLEPQDIDTQLTNLASNTEYSRTELETRTRSLVTAGNSVSEAINTTKAEAENGQLWNESTELNQSNQQFESSSDPQPRWSLATLNQDKKLNDDTEELFRATGNNLFTNDDGAKSLQVAYHRLEATGKNNASLSYQQFVTHYKQQRQSGYSHNQAIASVVETTTDQQATPITSQATNPRNRIQSPTKTAIPNESPFKLTHHSNPVTDPDPEVPIGTTATYKYGDGTTVHEKDHEKIESLSPELKTLHEQYDKAADEYSALEEKLGIETLDRTHYDSQEGIGITVEKQAKTRLDQLKTESQLENHDEKRLAETFTDVHAAAALAGDTSVSDNNTAISEDGTLKRTRIMPSEKSPAKTIEENSRTITEQANRLGIDVNEDDIEKRTKELAQKLVDNQDTTPKNTGMALASKLASKAKLLLQ